MFPDLKSYLVKQQIGMLKVGRAYDIYNPENQQQLALAREVLGPTSMLLKLCLQGAAPRRVEVTGQGTNNVLFTIHKPFAFFRSMVNVLDAGGKRMGYFRSKLMSMTSGFWVYDDKGQQIAELKGKWTGREFKYLTPDGQELGSVGKPVGGLGGMAREFLMGADTYTVNFTDTVHDADTKQLLLAAPLAIDLVFHYEH